MSRQHTINKLHAELKTMNEELNDYKTKYLLLSKESAKETTIINLQDKVLQLEAKCAKAKDELDEHISHHRRAVQAAAEMSDELASVKSEYEGFKTLIMSDMVSMQNELEKELKAAAAENAELASLRTEMSLWSSRVAFAEKKLESVQNENRRLAMENRRLAAKVSMEDDRVKLLQSDCAKWNRIALVAAAAKNRESDLLSKERRRTAELERVIEQLQKEHHRSSEANAVTISGLRRELTSQKEKNGDLSLRAEILQGHVDHLTESLGEARQQLEKCRRSGNAIASKKLSHTEGYSTSGLVLEPQGYRILFGSDEPDTWSE